MGACTGCSGLNRFEMFGEPDLLLAADAEALEVWNDGVNGIITNTRGNPDQKSSYWQHREKQTAVKGLRFKRVEK